MVPPRYPAKHEGCRVESRLLLLAGFTIPNISSFSALGPFLQPAMICASAEHQRHPKPASKVPDYKRWLLEQYVPPTASNAHSMEELLEMSSWAIQGGLRVALEMSTNSEKQGKTKQYSIEEKTYLG